MQASHAIKNQPKPEMFYEQDFCLWLEENVALLRQGRWSESDMQHIAEELEEMGRGQHNALSSHLRVLLMHLLKWQYQPARRSKSWLRTLREQRLQIRDALETSPSLSYRIEEKIDKAYQDAIALAADETGLPRTVFPATCPYSWERITNPEFFPEPL